ncbi:hypothetical protein LQE92_02065 [Lacrimispora sp. NSJ-141]|uniref:Lipoprotein n=1 Tax=Lientehia hominis TaxID=2897778 RepID=A0AAP2W6L8_9FIRM|nr:hypothetical protein [Lientehia hominis]MCD2491413.1 hypothetical protein [Lientehia hominis]
MKKKFACFLTAMLAVAAVISGCGKKIKFEPESSSIYVKKDGTVVSADMETFSGSNYSEEELKTYVEDAVKAYNKEHGAEASAYADEKDKDASLPVSVESLEVKDEIASLFLNYASCADYLEFTGTAGMEGGIGQMEKSTVTEMTLEGEFQNAKGETASLDGVTKNGKYHVVKIEGPVTMQVEGKVQFASSGVTIDGDHTVTTPGTGVSFIVFK